jgi:hypothetical protein
MKNTIIGLIAGGCLLLLLLIIAVIMYRKKNQKQVKPANRPVNYISPDPNNPVKLNIPENFVNANYREDELQHQGERAYYPPSKGGNRNRKRKKLIKCPTKYRHG